MMREKRREASTRRFVHAAAQRPAGRSTTVRERVFVSGTGDDLFGREQAIHDGALERAEAFAAEGNPGAGAYLDLAQEYGRMLKYLRRATRQSDLTAGDLHSRNLDLLDKAFYDEVTGIYNRRFLDAMLAKTARHSARSLDALTVLMIDIDYFKNYNDAYGHSAGDVCLRAVAQTIHSCAARGNDFAARYGGEEFALVLPGTDAAGADSVAEHVLRSVRALAIPHAENTAAGVVTVSVGAATMLPVRSPEEGGEILRRADEALYRAKRDGRDRHAFFLG